MAGANYNVNNIEMNFVATMDSAFSKMGSLKEKIAQLNKELEGTNIQFQGITQSVSSTGVVSFETHLGTMTEQTNKLGSSFKNAGLSANYLTRAIISIFSIRNFFNVMNRSIEQIASYAENFNLFNVTMKDHFDEAIKFQHELSNMYGVNIMDTMRYQGFFQNLVTALGIGSDEAIELSRNLTLLTYDMASLFNWQPDMAFQRLQAGIVGQTKPLRYAGIDVTQQTIQPILGELGIEKQVTQLTQAEKVLLRYIAILRQSGNAQGDYARTIESPANQMKILTAQVQQAYMWFGALFIGLFSRIIPYVNAFVMVLKEVFKSLAMLLGFSLSDFDFLNGDGFEGVFEGLEDEIDGATKSLEKLRGGLRKFDEINNISLRQSAGGVVSGGTTQQKLQELLNIELAKYEGLMGKVSLRANEIRDSIFKTLGFIVSINDETGELELKWTIWSGLIVGAIGLMGIGGLLGVIKTVLGSLSGILAIFGVKGGATGIIGVLGKSALLAIGWKVALAGILTLGLANWFNNIKEKVEVANKPISTLEMIVYNIGTFFENAWKMGVKFFDWLGEKLGFKNPLSGIIQGFKDFFDIIAKFFGIQWMKVGNAFVPVGYDSKKVLADMASAFGIKTPAFGLPQESTWFDTSKINPQLNVTLVVDKDKLATTVVNTTNQIGSSTGQVVYMNW